MWVRSNSFDEGCISSTRVVSAAVAEGRRVVGKWSINLGVNCISFKQTSFLVWTEAVLKRPVCAACNTNIPKLIQTFTQCAVYFPYGWSRVPIVFRFLYLVGVPMRNV